MAGWGSSWFRYCLKPERRGEVSRELAERSSKAKEQKGRTLAFRGDKEGGAGLRRRHLEEAKGHGPGAIEQWEGKELM